MAVEMKHLAKDIAREGPVRLGTEASEPSVSSVLSLQVRKRFDTTGRSFELDVRADIHSGFTIVFGPSGAGKTTLLECIAGLITPTSGRIAIGSRLFFDSSRKVNIETSRRRIGYVFQDLALFPHLSAEKNIEYGIRSLNFVVREQKTANIIQSFRISDLRGRKPAEISGGERQRVALARSLVTEPCVLLLDEPLAALDTRTKSKIIDDLRAWNDVHGIPILYVTHSREEVFALGDRVLILEAGKVTAEGTPQEVMRE
jgi:molybdate transport system ATP-binding protein